MGWQVERSTYSGKGWSAGEFCALLKTFLTNSFAAGGANWYVYDDQSAAGSDPYVVFCDTSGPSANDLSSGPSSRPPKFVKVTTFDSSTDYVFFYFYAWWDSTGHVGYGSWAHFNLYVTEGDHTYDFRGGDNGFVFSTYITGSWYLTAILDFDIVTDIVGADVTDTISNMTGSGATRTITVSNGANFTADEWYFISDFDESNDCCFLYVDSISSNDLTVSLQENDFPNLSSGAKIHKYSYKYMAFSIGKDVDLQNYLNAIPMYTTDNDYMDVTTNYSFYDQSGINWGQCYLVADDLSLLGNTYFYVDRDEHQLAQVPIFKDYIGPNANSYLYNGRRLMFKMKNLLIHYNANFTPGQDGITVDSLNYLYFGKDGDDFSFSSSSSLGLFFLETESV